MAALEFAGLDGKALRLAAGLGHAGGGQRAACAVGPTNTADRGAQVHQALGVDLNPSLRQKALSPLPKLVQLTGHRQVAFEAQCAGEHTLDVAVQDGHALAKTKGRNRSGR